MSFEALLCAVKYARFEIALDACREAVVRIQRKTTLGAQRPLPALCLLPDIFIDATKGQIEDGTPSCRQHQVPSRAKRSANSFKPSPSSESLLVLIHSPLACLNFQD